MKRPRKRNVCGMRATASSVLLTLKSSSFIHREHELMSYLFG